MIWYIITTRCPTFTFANQFFFKKLGRSTTDSFKEAARVYRLNKEKNYIERKKTPLLYSLTRLTKLIKKVNQTLAVFVWLWLMVGADLL